MATPFAGAKSAIGATALKLIAAATPVTYGVTVKAAHANTGQVCVGTASTVTCATADATDGFELSAGEQIFIPAYVTQDISTLYVIASTTGQKVSFLGY